MNHHLPTIRSRLALRAFALTFPALVVIFLVGAAVADRIIVAEAETSADAYLATLVAELEVAESPTAANVVAPVVHAGSHRIAQVVNQDSGEVLLATSLAYDTPLVDPDSLVNAPVRQTVVNPTIPGERIVIAARTLVVDGSPIGVIGGVSLPPPLLGFNGTLLTAIIIAVMMSAVVAAGAWISVRSALRPVDELSTEAEQIAMASSSGGWELESEATTAELDRLIRRLNSLLTRVREVRERERVFLEDASHDLRTPLAVARAELELASSTSGDPDTHAALASAIEELDRLDRLTGDLLILAKMRATPTHPDTQVQLGHLVRSTAARMIRAPGRRDLKISVEGRASVRGDATTLERAIENILANATKFAATSVDVEIIEVEETASIRVRDDGEGFAVSQLSADIRRFARVSEGRQGTGLGLAIASAIVAAHGGSLQIGNQERGGAEVNIRLPADTTRDSPQLLSKTEST